MASKASPLRLYLSLVLGMLVLYGSISPVEASARGTGASLIPTPTPVIGEDPPLVHPNLAAHPNPLTVPDAQSQPPQQPEEGAYPFDVSVPVAQVQTALRPPLVEVPFALSPHDHFYFQRPFPADQVSWPEPDYRYGGVLPDSDTVHSGIDIDVPMSTPVLATAPGKVVWAGYGLFNGAPDPDDPYGIAVAIRHDFSYQDKTLFTIYAHLSRVDVVAGQVVERGAQLGLVGDTGKTTGPHLHFEVRLGQNTFFDTRNPELWLAPPEGWGILAGRVMDSSDQLMRSKYIVVRPVGNDDLAWVVFTYGRHAVNSDDYYRENVVLSDLPAGDYEITVEYLYQRFREVVHVSPGQITYFTFHGKKGFRNELPPSPGAEYLPFPPP